MQYNLETKVTTAMFDFVKGNMSYVLDLLLQDMIRQIKTNNQIFSIKHTKENNILKFNLTVDIE